jgi:hypothetical protein
MYSVIRFTEIQKEEMEKIAILINSKIKGFCDDIMSSRRDSLCFSCSLSRNEEWWDHHEEIHEILQKIRPAIIIAKRGCPSLEIQIDIEVGSPDYSWRLITEVFFTPDLLRLLAELNITIGTSIYYPHFTPKEGSDPNSDTYKLAEVWETWQSTQASPTEPAQRLSNEQKSRDETEKPECA